MGGWKEIEYPLTEKAFCCEHCGNTTLMKEIANKTYIHTDANPEEMSVEQMKYTWMILVCCICNKVNIIEDSVWSEDEGEFTGLYDQNGDEIWTNIIPTRKYLYRSFKDLSDLQGVSPQIKRTYQDALNCFKLELYTPTVIMCRKTIECLCVIDLRIREPYNLSDKIQRMLDEKYIDEMLYDWANTLNQFGNNAVHQFKIFNQDEARHILDFTYALIEYCLDFQYKFEQLKNNKKIKKTISQESQESTDEVKVDTLSDSEVESLDKMLDDENVLFRYYAAMELAKANAKIEKIVPILIKLHDDKNKNLNQFRHRIYDSLKKLASLAVSDLIKLLTDSSVKKEIKLIAVKILGEVQVDSQESVEALINTLTNFKNLDKGTEISIAAINSLEKLKSEKLLSELIKVIKDPSSNEDIRNHALIKIQGDAVSSVIKIYEEQSIGSDTSAS